MGTVTDSNNRLTDADTVTGFASDGGGGAGPQNEPDFGYQLTSGANYGTSRKIGTAKGGHIYTHGSTIDMTAEANQVWIAKAVWSNSINVVAYPACGLKIGNSATIYYEYGVYASDQGDLIPDPKRLARIIIIDPNVAAWPDIISGTPPTLTTIDAYGIQGDFGGSAKSENVVMDAIDLARGVGVLWITGSASVFADFVAYDEGDATKRIGHISTVREGVLEVFGKLWIGRTETPTATSTQFDDSALNILFGAGYFDAGWTGLGLDLGHASTTIALTDIVFKGQGQNNRKVYFDTIDQVDPTPDEVTLSPATGFITGTPVIYNNNGGSDSIGLTSGSTYWLERVTATTFNVHSTRNGARTAGTPIALSDGSTGESHWFQRTPDIRPEMECVGTSGTFDSFRCTYDAWAQFILTTACVFTSDIFRACGLIDMTTNNGGSLQGCSLTGQTTEPGEALVKTNTPVNIDDCSFAIAGNETGHAIEIDTAGTYAFDGNEFTGYWTSPDNENGAEFDTTSGVGVDATGEDITTTGSHGFSSGDEVWYNDNGGTDTIGLTDGARYYVNVISATNFSLHRSKHNALADTNRVPLNATGTGETHTFYSGKAAIVNTSGGLVTLNVGGGAVAMSVRNVGVATTVVNNNISVTFAGLKDNTEVRIYETGTATVVDGIEDATAGTTDNRTFSFSAAAALGVDYVLHNFENGVSVYKTIRVVNYTIPSTDTTINVQQVLDRNVS